mmetsp:Transcript_14870/g.27893  ORF Transcript_14870/g.27893 Transcript_14870/m.27893 type:complete len:735 (+) Transcript_14870:55-2259(+)
MFPAGHGIPGESFLEGDAVTLDRLQPVRQLSVNSARILYKEVGYLIDRFPKPVVLADALVPDCPIVGASDSFAKLSGYPRNDILGKNCRFLLKDVPGCCISRSGRKNLRSMIRMCRLIGLSTMGSTSCCQTNRKRDGETFLNMFAVGLVLLNEHPFLVGVQSEMGTENSAAQMKQDQHALIEQIRVILQQGLSQNAAAVLAKEHFLPPRPRNLAGSPAFSSAALTERVILLNDRRTVMRREPCEIPNGCVVISEQPLRRTRNGLFFAVRMEGVLREGWHSTWPMLGMTEIPPGDMVRDGYPLRAEWCAKSVCIGGEFQAFVREKAQHFQGLGTPTPDELNIFDGPRPRWQNRPTTPWDLGEGDVMGMLYTPQGDVHLMINYQSVLSFSTGKPLGARDYYALVDCRGQAYELMLLPYEMPVVGYMQELALQPLISHKVVDHVAKTAASRAVSNCTFSVSVADPSLPDMPLVAVSKSFEVMTGFTCEEIVGLNCRFLNHDCEMSPHQRYELRKSCQTGKPFTGLLQNRRKSGDLFVNLLDLRGLKVAKDAETGEDIWYLVGIQSDVTNLVDKDGQTPTEIRQRHAAELQDVANNLREQLQREFAELALTARHSIVAPEIPQLRLEAGDSSVSVPAAPGIERGPKPNLVPMIALLSEPGWLKHDSEDDDSEPEQVDKRAKKTSGGIHSYCSVTKLQERMTGVPAIFRRQWSFAPIAGAFVVGVGCALVCQLLLRHRK